MTPSERRHLGRQEEAVEETGIQIRNDEPALPQPNQTWINTSQNKMKTMVNGLKVILAEGSIGAAVELPGSGIMDVGVSRSYYKDVNNHLTINSYANFTEGLTAYLKISNSNPNTKEVADITIPGPLTFNDGSYFLINSASNLNKYYVWMDFNGENNDPFVGGRQGVRVITTAGLPEITKFTLPGGNDIGYQHHFLVNTGLDAIEYFVWFNVNGAGGQPQYGDKTPIQVSINSGDTDLIVASKVKDAIDLAAGLSATLDGNMVTVTSDTNGVCSQASNVSMSASFIIEQLQAGVTAETPAQLAVKVAQALNDTNDFVIPAPSTAILNVTNSDFGFTDDATNGNMGSGFAVNVTTQGSGRVNIIWPSGTVVDDDLEGGVVEGSSQRVFRLIKSGSYILVSELGNYSI